MNIGGARRLVYVKYWIFFLCIYSLYLYISHVATMSGPDNKCSQADVCKWCKYENDARGYNPANKRIQCRVPSRMKYVKSIRTIRRFCDKVNSIIHYRGIRKCVWNLLYIIFLYICNLWAYNPIWQNFPLWLWILYFIH